MDQDTVSVGGWIDLSPTFALKNAGCEQVVYFTRYTYSSQPGFVERIMKLLGADSSEVDALMGDDLSHADRSAFLQAIKAADAVWCTDWDSPPMGAFDDQFKLAYNGTMYSDSLAFTGVQKPYEGIVTPHPGVSACVRP